MALASSYAADCTNDSERNIAFGWFHGSMFFGMATGPVLGGYIGMIGGKSRPMLILYTALVRLFQNLFLRDGLAHYSISDHASSWNNISPCSRA